jgi:drug/metabolite transporter (DMT)-like permease
VTHGAREQAPRRRALAYLLLATLFFAALPIALKEALVEVAPIPIAALRAAGAAIILVTLDRVSSRSRPAPRDWPKFAVLGLLGVAANQLLYIEGLSRIHATTATVLVAAIPIFTLAIAASIGQERLTLRRSTGVALSFGGILTLVGAAAVAGLTTSLVGDLFVLLNALSYASYLVFARPLIGRYGPTTTAAWVFGFGSIAVFLFASSTLASVPWGHLPIGFWAAMAFVVLFGTVGAYWLSVAALSHVQSSTVASFSFLQPVVTAALAAFFFHDSITLPLVVGGGFILVGVAVASTGGRARKIATVPGGG